MSTKNTCNNIRFEHKEYIRHQESDKHNINVLNIKYEEELRLKEKRNKTKRRRA